MRSIIFASTVVLMGLQAQAKTSISLNDGKIFAPMKGSPATAGYGTFVNDTDKDVIIAIDKVAPFKAVETHQTLEKDGKMAMEKVDTLTVPAHGSLELKQGGNHIMLFEPIREVKPNETIKASFKVDGKKQDFKFTVVPRVESSEEHHHHH